MIRSRLAAAVVGITLGLLAPTAAGIAMADDGAVDVSIRDGSLAGSTQQAEPRHVNGVPGDDRPASSPGANPGVPLGPGH